MSFDIIDASTAVAAALFALTFLFGYRVHPLQGVIKDRRSIVSFGAGVSTAYLFVRMMPELSDAQHALNENRLSIYMIALIGFVIVYGMNHFSRAGSAILAAGRTEARELASAEPGAMVLGMTFYVFLLTFVLVREPAGSPGAVLQFAIAISFHFLAVDHSLEDELGDAYHARTRFRLAGACLVGWVLGQFAPVSDFTVAILFALVSGGVIVNSAVMELPTEKDGRFLPFAAGCLLFGLVLMTL
ncbi:hypothetical protein [Tabrizicola sp. BL-A-41-H6]|uniref:hypothetical protein n=1 Tax=Tabrizicola sp. BL-A-41-H6 TaxID=3421107 RepID=UPI003D67B37A